MSAYGNERLNWGGIPYIATVDGGLHAFCLISEDALGKCDFRTIKELADFTPNSIVMDPWLNTTCRAADCRNRFEAKLDAWQSDGKRIRMSDFEISEPNGRFRTRLIDGFISLKRFDNPQADVEALMAEIMDGNSDN